MSRERVTAYEPLTKDGVSLQELRQIVDSLLNDGYSPHSQVRVRTFVKANQHGSPIKKLTVIEVD